MTHWIVTGCVNNNLHNNNIALRTSVGTLTNLNPAMNFLSSTISNGTLTLTITPPTAQRMIYSATVQIAYILQ